MNDIKTRTAVVGPLDQAVRRDPDASGADMRRVIRAARLCEELGHKGDTLAALEELRTLRLRYEDLIILIQRVAKYPASVDCAGTLLRADVMRVAGPRETWTA